ncbi:FKBP-type peptidyl-prolyl cis-trans isomerase [Alkalimonas sp. MEB108]|uniref:Peptidyl-prolyl cis-trans isomerase n=1 Tax=Alkalimonas cellulosilytica TaxID=3058395 RepID=A0ABU7J3A0_9GAMM|nr:FKBP-type peptidyl-prolyl cis-trans isomerase [Alkalimonas sp. MEB108]MEE2000750.1 FKBP-type peptidyl-prolyl cis-trans isomerase [Alkalimonas sp. MEB108]
MRVTTKLSLVAASVLTLAACQPASVSDEGPVTLTTDTQKQSYSFGVSAGYYIENAVAEHQAMGIELDADLIVRGMKDAIAGKAIVTEEDIQQHLTALDQSFREKQEQQAQAAAAEAKAVGQRYLADNASKDGVQVTESGLQYEVLEQGDGAKPAAADTVKVHYQGALIDGTVFDSSHERGEPIEFPLNRVIPGWTEGVQLMNVGSKFRFTIPSELAYGERDMGVIPPNSVLVFEVELLDVKKAGE